MTGEGLPPSPGYRFSVPKPQADAYRYCTCTLFGCQQIVEKMNKRIELYPGGILEVREPDRGPETRGAGRGRRSWTASQWPIDDGHRAMDDKRVASPIVHRPLYIV